MHHASDSKSVSKNRFLLLWFAHGHHLLVQGGWKKQRDDTVYSGGTESAHHPGTAADVTENPPPSVQNPSEMLKLLQLALAG